MTDSEKQNNYKCFVCGGMANQNAHMIGNRKTNKKMYSRRVINSPLNVLPACSLHCNSLIDLGFHEELKEQVALLIESDMNLEEIVEAVQFIVKENIKRKEAKVER